MNDWILDILIKPDLKKSDADKIAKRLAQAIKTELGSKNLGSIKVDDKDLEKSAGNLLKSVNSVLRDLSKNIKSFTNTIKQAQGTAGAAAATTVRSSRAIRPVSATPDPGYPSRAGAKSAVAAFSGSGGTSTGAATKSKTAAVKKELEKNANKGIDLYRNAFTLLLETPAEFSKTINAAAAKLKVKAKTEAQKATRALTENVTQIMEALRIVKVDPGIVSNLQQYRQPVKNLTSRFRQENLGSPPVTKATLDKQFSSKQYKYADESGSGFGALKSAMKALSGVAKRPGSAPEMSVTSILSEIGKLTSGAGRPGAVKASGAEFGKLQKQTDGLVRDTLRRIALKLESETKKVGKQIDALKMKGGEGAEKEIVRLSGRFNDKVNRQLEVLRAIDRGSERFNINLSRDTKGGAGKPGRYKEEAGFLQEGTLRSGMLKELELNKAASQAVKIAKSFKDIPDPIERAQKIFREIWSSSKRGAGDLSKTIALVSETLKNTHVSGLVNRRELQEVVGLLDKYRSQIQNFRVQTKGLGGAGASHPVVPAAFNVAEEGGTNKAYLRRVEQIRRDIAGDANIKKGVKIPITIPVETAGGIRNIRVEFNKLGSTFGKVIPKAREMSKSMSMRDSIGQAFRRVSLWGAAAGITYGAINAFRQAGRTMLEVETGVVNLSKVVRSADSDLIGFADRAVSSAKRIATEYGTSMQEVFKSMRIFAQQGMEMIDVIELTEATSIAANTTVLDQAKAAEGLTSAIKQFGLEASSSMQIVDAWNEVAKRNAVTELTLVDALKKAGSAARTVGVDFNQLIGLTTAVGEATRQPGKEVGTSLRFIFQRTLRPDSAKALAKVGVATKDLEGNFRGFMAIIGDLAGMWEDLSNGQQLAIAQALGGARQYNAVVALMNNYATAVKASEDALNSQGSAQLENVKVMGTTTKIFAQTKASLDALSVSLGKVFLPFAQGAAVAVKSLVDVFASMPAGIHASVGGLALMTVAITRLASQADMVMMGGAGAGAASTGGGVATGIAAGLIGRGKKGIDPLSEKGTGLGEFGIAAVGLSDFSSGAVKSLSSLDGKLVDINGRAVQGSEKFSKMGLAIRRMGHVSAETGEKTLVGFQHMNSPLSKLILLFGFLGKGVLSVGTGIVNMAARGIGALRGLTAATVAQAAASRTAAVANAGLAASFAGLAVGTAAVIGGYYLIKYLYKLATAQRKTGEQTQKDLRSELSKRQEVLRALQAQQSLLTSLATKRSSIDRAGSKEGASKGVGLNKPSADFRRYNLELKAVKSASAAAIVDPSAIDRFDKFGNAVLKAGDSFKSMSKAAIQAQSHLVALTRLKIATAFAKDVEAATAKLDEFKELVIGVHKVARIEAEGLGGVSGGVSSVFSAFSKNTGKQTAKVNKLVSSMISQIKALPKETALFSLQEFADNENIMKALEISIRENNSAFQAMGKPVATATDKLIQLSLTVKGFKGIGLKVFQTKDLYKQKNVAITSLADVVKAYKETKSRLKGGELVLMEGDNPLGLTQASTAIDNTGTLVVEGFDKNGKRIKKAFTEFIRSAGDPNKVKILDPSILTKRLNESVLRVKKKLSGAGTGLIDLSGSLDLGVSFDFQLGDVDRLQKSGKASSEAIIAAYQAQKSYNASLVDFNKMGKDNPKAALSKSRSEQVNVQRATISATLHMVKFISVIESLGNSFAKAAHELNKANITDNVESQFGAVYGTISGFSEKLTVKLPKTLDELSPDERLSKSNPELIAGIRSGQRAMDKLKSQIVAMEQLSGGDIQKMFEAFTNQDQKIFTSAMESLGGDLKGATIVTHLNSISNINKKGFSDLVNIFTKQPDKKDVDKNKNDQIKAAGKTVDALLGSLAKYVSASYLLGQGGLKDKQRKELEQQSSRSLEVLGLGAPTKKLNIFDKALQLKSGRQDKIRERVGISTIVKGAVKEALAGGKSLDIDKVIRDVAGKASAAAAIKSVQTGARSIASPLKSKEGNIVRDSIYSVLGAKQLPSDINILNATVQPQLENFAKLLAKVNATGLGDKKDQQNTYNALKNIVLFAIKQGQSKLGGLDTPSTASGGAGLAVAQTARSAVFKAAQRNLAKTLSEVKDKTKDFNKKLLGLSTSLGLVGKGVQSFIYNISKGIDQIRNTRDLGRLTRSVSAPIAGQLKGVSVAQVGLGKLKGDLSPVERVAKQFSSYFTNIAEQETARTGAVGLFSNMSAQLLKVRKDIKGLLTGGEKLSNRKGLLKLQSKAEGLYKSMGMEMSRVNNRMSPFIESLTRMVRLEAAKKSIDAIINSLKKAEDLEFDTTSIDKALGRHPLSAVRPQFGEPAGLDKFQQQLFQLQQKQRAGTISGEDFSYEKKKIGFQKEESVIQYQQSKENSKLGAEVEAAKRAMGILWDAQSQGIGGVGGLIQTLKTDLESAGDSTDVGGGVREFKGVPGLFGIDKELAKVQAAVKEKNFSQQRDIVMAPLEGLQTEANKLLSDVKDEIAGQAEAIASAVSGGKDKNLAGAALGAYGKIGKGAQESFNTAVQAMSETMLRAQETINKGTDQQVDKLLGRTAATSASIVRLGVSAVGAAKALVGAATYVKKAIDIPSAAPGNPTATPPRNKATGGFITGPAGIDNVPARLTAGEYVIPKSVVSQYGTSFFDSIRSGKLSGFAGGGGVGKSVDVNKDMGDIFGITGILKSGGDYSVLSSKGNLGKQLYDFIGHIARYIGGSFSGNMTEEMLNRMLKDAGLGSLSQLSGFAEMLKNYVMKSFGLKSKPKNQSGGREDKAFIPRGIGGGSMRLSRSGKGVTGDILNMPGVGGGSMQLSGSDKNVSGSYGYTRDSGKFSSSLGTSSFSGREKKSGHTGLTASDLSGAKFVIGGKEFNSQREIDDYYKANTHEAFNAFGPSPGQMNARTLYNTGGRVSGAGGVDNVPARLTKGEYVIPKGVVDKYGTGFFDSLRSGKISGFADGGSVGQQANFDTSATKAEKVIGSFYAPILVATGQMDKFSDSLAFLITNISNQAKAIKFSLAMTEALQYTPTNDLSLLESPEEPVTKEEAIAEAKFRNSISKVGSTVTREGIQGYKSYAKTTKLDNSASSIQKTIDDIKNAWGKIESSIVEGINGLDIKSESGITRTPSSAGVTSFAQTIEKIIGPVMLQLRKVVDRVPDVGSRLNSSQSGPGLGVSGEGASPLVQVVNLLKSFKGGSSAKSFTSTEDGIKLRKSKVGLDPINQPGFSVRRAAVPGVRSAATTTQLPPESIVSLADKVASAINKAYAAQIVKELKEVFSPKESKVPNPSQSQSGTYFGLGKRPIEDINRTGGQLSAKFQSVQDSVYSALNKYESLGPDASNKEIISLIRSLKQSKSAAADLFKSNKNLEGLTLPRAFQSDEQYMAGGQSALSSDKQVALPEGYRNLIKSLNELENTLGGYKEGLPPPGGFKEGPKKESEAKEGTGQASLDKLADRVYNAILEGLRDSEITISKDSLTEMEASIRRGGESISDSIAKAAPTLSGNTGAGGSLGSAIRPELEQLNGRVDAIGEKIILEKDALLSNLNERFSDIETQMMSEIKGLYDSKFAQAETKSNSTLAYVRRVEALLHSVNSRTGDL